MKKTFLLITLVATVAIVAVGISYVYLEKTKWYIEINGKKYKETDFKKFGAILKATQNVSLSEKEVMNKFIEVNLLLENKEVNKLTADPIELDKRIENFKKSFEIKERFDNFLKENNITSHDIKEYFIKEIKIDNFFREKTKNIVLTDEEKKRIYAEIEKHASPQEMNFVLQNKERFEEEILKGKKKSYRDEYVANILKRAKVYINK